MQLTGDELTASSSVVAALAIVGGYLGVRSANQNALKIAKEERSSRRSDELGALRRAIYARCIAALNAELAAYIALSEIRERAAELSKPDENLSAERNDAIIAGRQALVVARNCIAELELVAPATVSHLGQEVLAVASDDQLRDQFTHRMIALQRAMRHDLDREGPLAPQL